jgi:hypothetical protein
MINKSICGLFAASVLVVCGCDRAAEQQEKADDAMEEARAKTEKVQADAGRDTRKIQEEADGKMAEAQAAFLKIREDHRHKVEKNLLSLDEDITKLSARAQTEGTKSKLVTESQLSEIRMKRGQFESSFSSLGRATAREWDASRELVDQEWDDLKKLMSQAS